MLILAVAGQFFAVLAGSNGLLLLMTDNERPTAVLHAVHAVIVLPVMIVLARRHGVVGLGVAYWFFLAFNNVTELWLLGYLEGVWPFTREHWLLAACSVLVALSGSAIAAATPAAVSIPFSVAAGTCVAVIAYSSDKEKAHPFTGGMNPTTWERISVSANGSFIHIESVLMTGLRRLSRPTKRIISDSAQATFERTPFEPLAVGSGQNVTLTPSMG